MTTYYRTTDAVLIELDPDLVAALAPNKRATLLPFVVDPKPSGAGQVADLGPIVFSQTEARQTWVLRPMTQAELNGEANTADAPTIKAQSVVDALTASIQLDRTALTQAQRMQQIETDLVRLLRIARYYVRSL
jgi:hypothetical protein